MPILIRPDEDDGTENLSRQALSFGLHTILGVGAWLLLMLAGYALNPVSVSQSIVLLLSIIIPLTAGNIVKNGSQPLLIHFLDANLVKRQPMAFSL